MWKTNIGLILLLTFILLASTSVLYQNPVIPAAEAQQLTKAERNWEKINYDEFGANYNPQKVINKENVNLLELKWIYLHRPADPLPGFPTATHGSDTPPLIVDGVIYIQTHQGVVIALNAETGKVVWTTAIPYNRTALEAKYPHVQGGAFITHRHGISYYEKFGPYGPTLVPEMVGCQMDAVDALTGKIRFQIFELCGTFEEAKAWGSQSHYSADNHPPAVFGNILVIPVGGRSGGGGRAFVAGYDISSLPAKRIWQTFIAPPAQGDPEWALRECDKGRFAPSEAEQKAGVLAVACSQVRSICRECLLNDWIDPVTGRMHTASAVSSFWGHYPLDPETGIVYIGTGEIGPYWNGSRRPGPNLYGSSIIALNARNGQMVWWFSDNPHDMWDMDCSWNTILGKIGTRKVVLKSCKAGVYRAFDAATGEVLWAFDPPSIWRPACCPIKGLDPKSNSLEGGIKQPWPEYPKYNPAGGKTFILVNGGAQGVQESDNAFDGKRWYVAPYNRPQTYTLRNVIDIGNQAGPSQTPHPLNTTIWAIDAATGRPVWSFFIPTVGLRGGLIVSGGVLYVPSPDGNIYMLDADNGKLITTKYFATALVRQPTIGATASGKMILAVNMGGGGTLGAGNIPGALMVYGLPDKLPEPQIITKEVIKEVPKEVVKEVIKEVPKEVVKEVVKEVPKEVVKEVVKEVPKEVVKEVVKEVPKEVTKTVTVETLSPITYVGVGLGIIIAVVGVVVGRRGRKAA